MFGDKSTSTTEIYDPATNTWSPGPALPYNSYGHCFEAISATEYLLIGGATGTVVYDTAGAYDTVSTLWSPKAVMPYKAWLMACSRVTLDLPYGDAIVMAGGSSDAFPWSNPSLDSAAIYMIAADSWTSAPAIPNRVQGARSTVVGGKMQIFGGQEYVGAFEQTVVYELASDASSWDPVETLAVPDIWGVVPIALEIAHPSGKIIKLVLN